MAVAPIGQFGQEFLVVTSAPVRRLAHAVVALAVAGPAVLLGGVAWADPTPAPADPAAEVAAPEAPVVEPSIGTWIIGGTELEGTAAKPAKPVAKPAAVTSGHTTRATTRTTTRTTSRTTTRATSSRTATRTGTAPDGATALPFTGNHVDALLPAGLTLIVGGVVLTLATRPRRLVAQPA
jgi:hypothetical protein